MFKLQRWNKWVVVGVLTALVNILAGTCAPIQLLAATAPSLGGVNSFAVLGASSVTNTGSTVIYGDLGSNPGTITGFLPGIVVLPGTIHANDSVAEQAQSDLVTIYHFLAEQTPDNDLTGYVLGTMTLVPGVYHFNTSAQLTGTLKLNAQNDPNSVFIFQIGSALTTLSDSSVVMINAPSNFCNVFWQVGSSATLGTGTSFIGNILADQSITLTNGASIYGRVLALNAEVTLDTNTVTRPCILTYTAGEHGSIMGTSLQTVPYGGNGTEVTAVPSTGYHFVDWSDNVSTVNTRTDTYVTADISTTANFAINNYTVTFDKNGGYTDASPISATTIYLSTVILPTVYPAKVGYTFNSWNTLADGSGSVFTASTVVTGDITVYAKWTINQYSISFNSNGGSGVTAITQDYGSTVNEPTAPTRTGYTFIGWYSNAELTSALLYQPMNV